MSTPTLQPEVRADVTTTNRPARPPSHRRRGRPNRLPYALIAPALVVMVLIHVLPAIGGLVLSFKKFNIFTFRELFGAPWNGLENYRSILLDTDNPLHSGFWGAVVNTIQYTFWTVSGTLVLGLAVALLLNRKMPGQRVARTLMLVPWIVPSYVVAVLWSFMWQSDVGIINKVLVDYTHLLGHRPIWLLGPNTMWAIVIPSIWRGLPLAILIFLAGLQAQPRELALGEVLGVAAELDVDAAARHVGGDGDRAGLAGLGHDLALALGVLGLGVEHGVRDAPALELLAEHL